ncbi:MAG: TPM domain-containing protein [Desulfuromonadales bacterium]|nr:TPM domain-containing protein [Desulfuromonadales bacterium]
MNILTRFGIFLMMVLLPYMTYALDAPPLKGRVNDYASMLPPEAVARLEQKLAAFERETSNQIAVLTVPALQGDNIDQFAIRVAEQWKIGQKGKDNGVLLIMAQAERKVRIEVGMGLQGVLPDITASQIIREVMRPHLKDGNFDQGINVGVDAIMAATKGEFKAMPQDASRRTNKKKSSSGMFLVIALIAIAVCGMMSRYLGGAAGAIGLPFAASMAFPGLGVLALFLLALGGLIGGFLLSMFLAGMSGGGFGGGGFGGYWGGGFGGGSSGGGGDDSFSGGGGDFDGGGSSGDY